MKMYQKVLLAVLIAMFPIGLFLTLMQNPNSPGMKNVENFETLLSAQIKSIEQLDAESNRIRQELVKIEEAKVANIEKLRDIKTKLEEAIAHQEQKVTQNTTTPNTIVNLGTASSSEKELPTFTPLKTKLGNMMAVVVEKRELENKEFFNTDAGKAILMRASVAGPAATVYLAGVQKPSKLYSLLRNTFEDKNQQEVLRFRDNLGSPEKVFIMIKQAELAAKADTKKN